MDETHVLPGLFLEIFKKMTSLLFFFVVIHLKTVYAERVHAACGTTTENQLKKNKKFLFSLSKRGGFKVMSASLASPSQLLPLGLYRRKKYIRDYVK